MTNAEKYLRDEADVYDFLQEYARWYYSKHKRLTVTTELEDFLTDTVKPILTTAERVILSNLRCEKGAYEYIKIGRTELDSEGNCDLILIDSDNESVWWGEYGHLFQFIKEGEEYNIKELLGDE